ncbi:uncharacterized protein METZ01_LOCUS94100 [marine metagenome]|uniref:Uncharacterized protein n=1 Tax=marine metagenome TaxID=408172 RepID=A0A381VLP6_9ZZZZ
MVWALTGGQGVAGSNPVIPTNLWYSSDVANKQEMFVSVVVGVLMLSACTPGLAQTWEMIGRALCVHGSGSFDRPACNGPDPGPAK